MKTIELAADTNLGKQRKDNQDIFICQQLWSRDQGLIGVIDGVGGYEGGDVAAGIAKECIALYMSAPKGDALSMLKEAVVLANNQIAEAREKDEKLSQMCCVLTVAVADAKNQVLYYVHVGDTRLYRFRKGLLEKITRDHSLVGMREDAGTLTEEEAMQHPRRNVILRQVGTEHHRIDDPEFLEFGETEFLPGDSLLICSDGLSDMITKEAMARVFKEQVHLPAIVEDLITLANEAGGHDNITVVLASNLSRQKRMILVETIPQPVVSLPVTPETGSAVSAKKTPVTFMGPVLLGGLLLLIGFLFFTKKTPGLPKPVAVINDTVKVLAILDTGISRSPNNSSQAVSMISSIDSLILTVGEHKGKELLLQQTGRDTIRLSHPVELGKILRLTGGKNNGTVLMPDTLSRIKYAIQITGSEKIKTKKDTVFLKNITIQGFDTGIHIEGHIILHLENVFFKKVEHTVSYKEIDSVRSGYLTF